MQLGMIGLGRMGANMVRRLMKGGHQCMVFDLNPAERRATCEQKARPVPLRSRSLVAKLKQAARGLGDGSRRRAY